MCDRNVEIVEMYQSAIEKREEAIKITTIDRTMFNETKGKELVPNSSEIQGKYVALSCLWAINQYLDRTYGTTIREKIG
jgi:hypothetical protein